MSNDPMNVTQKYLRRTDGKVYEALQLTFPHWPIVYYFVPQSLYLRGVFLDPETLNRLGPGKTSDTIGLLMKKNRKDKKGFLIRQGEWIVKVGVEDFCSVSEDQFQEEYTPVVR